MGDYLQIQYFSTMPYSERSHRESGGSQPTNEGGRGSGCLSAIVGSALLYEALRLAQNPQFQQVVRVIDEKMKVA